MYKLHLMIITIFTILNLVKLLIIKDAMKKA